MTTEQPATSPLGEEMQLRLQIVTAQRDAAYVRIANLEAELMFVEKKLTTLKALFEKGI